MTTCNTLSRQLGCGPSTHRLGSYDASIFGPSHCSPRIVGVHRLPTRVQGCYLIATVLLAAASILSSRHLAQRTLSRSVGAPRGRVLIIPAFDARDAISRCRASRCRILHILPAFDARDAISWCQAPRGCIPLIIPAFDARTVSHDVGLLEAASLL